VPLKSIMKTTAFAGKQVFHLDVPPLATDTV